jgi:hypothetical protein
MSSDDELGELFATLESEMETELEDSGVAGSEGGGAGRVADGLTHDTAAGACGGRKRGREERNETRESAEALPPPSQRGALVARVG